MDQESLVTIGRQVVEELQRQSYPISSALWLREGVELQWTLWIVPTHYDGVRKFFTVMQKVLANLRGRGVFLDISYVRPIEPGSMIARDLKRYGSAHPDAPIPLYSSNLGGHFVAEGLLVFNK